MTIHRPGEDHPDQVEFFEEPEPDVGVWDGVAAVSKAAMWIVVSLVFAAVVAWFGFEFVSFFFNK